MAAKHRHHIVPQHAGGTDDPLNLTPPISIRLHAMFHFDRWRHVGDVRDYAAYRTLLGQMTGAEARYLVVSELLRGRTFSPESLAKMSASQRRRNAEGRGRPHTPETRAKQSTYRKGRRDLIAAAQLKTGEANRARVWKHESRSKLGQSQRRFWASLSPEVRARRTAGIRRPLDAAARLKLSVALKGRPKSEQHKQRLRAAAFARVGVTLTDLW